MSPIIDIQRRMMELGRIRMGDRGPKGQPQRLAHWRLTSASRQLLEAAAAEYGGEVREWAGAPDEGYWELYTETDRLDVILPPVFSAADGSPTLPYSQWYELWSGGGCQRRCDGVTEVLSGKPCLCDPQERACQPTTRMSVMLPRVPGLGVWRLESRGVHAAMLLPATLDLLQYAAAERQFVEAVLRLEQRSVRRDGETHRFTVPVLDLPGLRLADVAALGGGEQPLAVNAPQPAPGRPGLPAGPAAPEEPEPVAERPAFGPPPRLPEAGSAPPAPEVVDEAEQLAERLLELGTRLNRREETLEALIRHAHDEPGKRLTWLRGQVTRAEKALTAAAAS